MQAQLSDLKQTKSQVTHVNGLRLDLWKFCAEQQLCKVEMGLEVGECAGCSFATRTGCCET